MFFILALGIAVSYGVVGYTANRFSVVSQLSFLLLQRVKTKMNTGSLILLQNGLFPEYTGKAHTILRVERKRIRLPGITISHRPEANPGVSRTKRCISDDFNIQHAWLYIDRLHIWLEAKSRGGICSFAMYFPCCFHAHQV